MTNRYEYAHSHTYEHEGQTLELAPIAILKVDETHPFPKEQGLNLVQIAELAEVVVSLVSNILVKLGNLKNVGAVPVPDLSGLDELEDGLELLEDGLEAANERMKTSVSKDDLEGAIAELHEHLGSLDSLLSAAKASASAETDDSGLALSPEGSIADTIKGVLEKLIEMVLGAIGRLAGLNGPAGSLGDYAEQFQTIVVPDVSATWSTDEGFARMRVAGPNPLVIERVRGALPAHFPVAEVSYARVMGAGDSIKQAIDEKRLYLADYKALSVMKNGTVPQQKYISAPLALFAIPKGTTGQAPLRPVAIQCYQKPSRTNPIFYPFHGDSWAQAKIHVQVADGNYHELISHLGLTHLLIEPFVVSSFRKLPNKHAVLTLLLPHFQGTLFINNAAVTSLIAPGGTVDRLLGGTITSDWEVTTNALGGLNFDEWMLPNELAKRGVGSDQLPLAYPYRDDALAVWGAISQWAQDYLSIFYSGDQAVADDAALQAWVQDLTSSSGGGINGLGQTQNGVIGIYTFDYLVEVITMVIFTASAQHAAVNFPQKSTMSYTPAMPLAAFAEPPSRTSGVDAKMLEVLPPLQQALLQLLVGQGLGGVYFTRLGDYNRHQLFPYFKKPKVQSALSTFQSNLAQVETTIGLRNLERPAYTQLLPSRIPQSINI